MAVGDDNNMDALGIARLEERLKTVSEQLTNINLNMVTKDLFTAQNQNVEFRFSSVEQQLAANRSDTIKDIAKVDAESKARDQAGEARAVQAATEIVTRLDKQEQRQFDIEQTQKEQKNSKWTAIGVTILGGLVTIVTSVVLIFLNNGITPS